jgi:hypothetical protein
MFKIRIIKISDLRNNPSSIWLILFNLIPIIGVVFLNWSILQMVVSYWTESLVLGAFNIMKMFKCEGSIAPSINPSFGGKPSPLTANPSTARIFYTVFFMFHYGGFCMGHLIFILVFFGGSMVPEGVNKSLDWTIIISVISFIIIHAISYKKNYIGKLEYKVANPKQLLFAPYGRIVLTHVFIMATGFIVMMAAGQNELVFKLVGVLLVLMKIFIDTNVHLNERDKYQQSLSANDSDSTRRGFV